jgi:hypothetical protein
VKFTSDFKHYTFLFHEGRASANSIVRFAHHKHRISSYRYVGADMELASESLLANIHF